MDDVSMPEVAEAEAPPGEVACGGEATEAAAETCGAVEEALAPVAEAVEAT